MVLEQFKGDEAFKVIGRLIREMKRLYQNEAVIPIVSAEYRKSHPSWTLDFMETSLIECSDVWMAMFLTLNPDKKSEEVSTMDVFGFANEFISSPMMMNLFFSQSQKILKTSSGSATENIEATVKK